MSRAPKQTDKPKVRWPDVQIGTRTKTTWPQLNDHHLTCNELLVLNVRDVSVETWEVKGVGPGIGALPVVEVAPRE